MAEPEVPQAAVAAVVEPDEGQEEAVAKRERKLTELQRRFCEIHATERDASKAWNMARFSLGKPPLADGSAKMMACRSKTRPYIKEYLATCKRIAASLLPNVVQEPLKSSQDKPHPASKYKPKYCQDIVAFFDVPRTETTKVKIQTRAGNTIEKEELRPLPPPHMSAFARSIGVHEATLKDWAAKHPDFARAYEWARDMFAEHITDCGLLGQYNSHFAKFIAVNRTDMRDRTAVDVTSEGRALAPSVSVMPPSPVQGEEVK